MNVQKKGRIGRGKEYRERVNKIEGEGRDREVEEEIKKKRGIKKEKRKW